jgi:hypothetical protein
MKRHPNVRTLLTILAATSISAAGCTAYAHGSANGEAYTPVTYASRPTLVLVDSGVWVVRGSTRATYYVGDSYWVYGDSRWYRSSSYGGGWVIVQASVVPTAIVSLNHATYVNFQGDATAATKPAPGNDVAANAPPPKKEEDELPGVGNKAKAAGEQPGEVGKGLGKEHPKDEPKASPPAAEASPKAGKNDKPDGNDHDNKKKKK